ncbi:MAG TPA: transcription factor IIS helical bundle-like domain-containing protein [Nitrospiraceae bacterium]|nr:transcription factor IIS helical bundle-like domain-containing protein [Nitrospiraceae bacterium]
MSVEEKWKANQEKVAFTKQFPGLTLDWQACAGKTVAAVIPLTGKAGAAVVVFTDGSFTVVPPLTPEPWELGQALVDARAQLEPKHRAAYAEYDRLAKKDKDALKSARLEKIVGAIQNNLEQIPELKDRLKELVKEWK